MSTAADLHSKYQLAKLPPHVKHIAALVGAIDRASIEQIGAIIAKSEVFSRRVRWLAFPKDENRAEQSIASAVERLGLGCIIVLLTGDLFERSVRRTFGTMLDLPLGTVSHRIPHPDTTADFAVSTHFHGKASGHIEFLFNADLGVKIAAKLMQCGVAEASATELIQDAASELGNMVVGNLRSYLSDAGLTCQTGFPAVARKRGFALEVARQASVEYFTFEGEGTPLLTRISVNPFAA